MNKEGVVDNLKQRRGGISLTKLSFAIWNLAAPYIYRIAGLYIDPQGQGKARKLLLLSAYVDY